MNLNLYFFENSSRASCWRHEIVVIPLTESEKIHDEKVTSNNNALLSQIIRPCELALCLRCVLRCERSSFVSEHTSDAWGELDRAHHLGQQSIVV